jgi:hypothetical protein
MGQLFAIFLNVLTPVFLLVLLGYTVGPRLHLEARTLSRFAYFVVTPAFVFNILSTARIELALASRMIGFISVVYIGSALIAFAIARLLRCSRQMTAIYVMLATFGNVGNFGLPIVQFALGDEALLAATIYFLSIVVVAFVICIAAANMGRGGAVHAIGEVFKTPALIALPPALLFNWFQVELPAFITRPVELLSGALIPTMLIVLGVQLANAGIPRPNLDIVVISAVRLLGGALLGFALAAPFGLEGMAWSAGILQASMPSAVLVSIIAMENDLMPAFVTTAVLFSNLASIVTLTVVLTML